MRWLSYDDGLVLGLIAAVAVVFSVIDYVWCKRELAKQTKLAKDEAEALFVRAGALEVGPEALPRGRPDDRR